MSSFTCRPIYWLQPTGLWVAAIYAYILIYFWIRPTIKHLLNLIRILREREDRPIIELPRHQKQNAIKMPGKSREITYYYRLQMQQSFLTYFLLNFLKLVIVITLCCWLKFNRLGSVWSKMKLRFSFYLCPKICTNKHRYISYAMPLSCLKCNYMDIMSN